MKKKNENVKPIYFKSKEELEKPLGEIMEDLRNDLSRIRGKLWDIKQTYGWDDRIEHIEGGLSCMLIAMYYTGEEWKEYEKKHRV